MNPVQYVPTRTALAALTPSDGQTCYLAEEGRAGLFKFVSGDFSGASATINITFTGKGTPGDTLRIGKYQFELVTGTPVGRQVQIGTSVAATAQAVLAHINANSLLYGVTASGAAAVLTLTARTAGVHGNSIGVSRYLASPAVEFVSIPDTVPHRGGNLAGGTLDAAGDDPLQGVLIPRDSDTSGATGAWVRDTLFITPEMFGWTAASTASESCQIINQALRHALRLSLDYVDNYARDVRGTINIPGPVVMRCGLEQHWQFDLTDTANDYVPVLHNPTGSTFTESGKFAAVDTAGALGLRVQGRLKLIGKFVANMKMATRAGIPQNLVAFTASSREEGSSSESVIDGLFISGFGYGLYQGSMAGATDRTILPYTRMNIRELAIQFCINPMESGANGTGFDDCSIEVLKITRCSGRLLVQGTNLTVASCFHAGLVPANDAESQTLAVTAQANTATLSAANSDIKVGTRLAILGVNRSKTGNEIPLVTRVIQIGGDNVTLTLEDAPDATLGSATFLIDPPSMEISTSALTAQHWYVEECMDTPVRLRNQAVFRAANFRPSGGLIACRRNTPIIATSTNAAVQIGVDPGGLNSEIKALVGLSMAEIGGVEPTLACRILTYGSRAEATTYAEPFVGVKIPGDMAGGSGTVDLSATGVADLNVVVHFGDGDYRYFAPGDATAAVTKPAVSSRMGWHSRSNIGIPTPLAAVAVYNATALPNSRRFELELYSATETTAGKAVFRKTSAGALRIVHIVSAVGGSFSVSGQNIQWTPTTGTGSLSVRAWETN